MSKVKKKKKVKIQRLIPAKEQVYLEGPKSRGYELGFLIRVFRQFLRGFRTLHFMPPCITVFGSARFDENLCITKKQESLGRKLPN